MDVTYLVIGLLIGIVFGVPIGAVGALTVRRTMEHGSVAGLVSGLGCSAADAVYAAASVFGFSYVAKLLAEYQAIIGLAGGAVLIVLGICVSRSRPTPAHARTSDANASLPAYFGSSFALGMSSPSTILLFLFAFAVFGIEDVGGLADGALLVSGITLGTIVWWMLLAWLIQRFRGRVTRSSTRMLNRVCGVFIVAFGLMAAVRPLLS